MYKQKYTNHLNRVWIREPKSDNDTKPGVRLFKRSRLTGRRVFERAQKAELKRELNAEFIDRLRTLAESRKVPGQYQKLLKTAWDGLSEDEQGVWCTLAEEEIAGTVVRDDRNLQIEA